MSEERIAREVRALVDQFPAPRPGFRDRVLAGVPDDRGLPRRRYWAAVGAAVLALALVATLVLGARGLVRDREPSGKATPAATATPSPAPSASTAPTPQIVNGALRVSESTPVVAFLDASDQHQVNAVTWDGQGPGRLGLRWQPTMGGTQSPDGSRFQSDATVLDRDGQVRATLATAGKPGVVWADDSRHLCQMTVAGGPPYEGPTTLQLINPGTPPSSVAQIGRVFAQSSTSVRACSVLTDRAVVAQTGPIGNALELWVVRLSTGDVVYHTTFSAEGGITTWVAASPDGQLFAETTSTCCPAGNIKATIHRASDGAVLGRLDGRTVVGFSWSSDLAITTDQASAWGGVPRVIRWATGQIVWSGPAGSSYRGSRGEPKGQRVAIDAGSDADPTARASDIWIVSPSGTASAAVRGIWF